MADPGMTSVTLVAMTSLTVFGCVSLWLLTRPIWSLVNNRGRSDSPGLKVDRAIRMRAAVPLTLLASILLGALIFLWSSLLLIGALGLEEGILGWIFGTSIVALLMGLGVAAWGHSQTRSDAQSLEQVYDQFVEQWRRDQQGALDRDGLVALLLQEASARATREQREAAFGACWREAWEEARAGKIKYEEKEYSKEDVVMGLEPDGSLVVRSIGALQMSRTGSVKLKVVPSPVAQPEQDPLGWLALPVALCRRGRFEVWAREHRARAWKQLGTVIAQTYDEAVRV